MNIETLHDISYGVYIVSSVNGDRKNGLIVNTVMQVTADPPAITVCVNKDNLTHEFIRTSKIFTVSILDTSAPLQLIGKFGFHSGRDTDKFLETNYRVDRTGAPIVLDSTLSYLEAELIDSHDVMTHTLFIGRVVNAVKLLNTQPMTYSYYHNVVKGRSPEKAPTYIKPELRKSSEQSGLYECTVCGYVYDPRKGDTVAGIPPGTEFVDLPPSWKCPVCGVGKDKFIKKKA